MEKGKWKRIFLMMMLFSVMFFASCSCSADSKDIAVRSLTINTYTKDVQEDARFSITYTVAPIETSIAGINIFIDNLNVVESEVYDTANNSGEIFFTAKKAGTAEIDFVTKDGEFSKTCVVTVYNTTTLQTPTNVMFKDDALIWDKVTTDINNNPKHADEKYELIVRWEGQQEEFILEDNKFAGNGLFNWQTDILYEVTVQAIGDGIKNYSSETSDSYSFYSLSTPTLSINNGLINWRSYYENNPSYEVANYFIITYGEDKYEIVHNNNNINNNFYDLKLNEQEDYAVTIQAIKSNLPIADVENELLNYINNQKELFISIEDGVHYVESKVSKVYDVHFILAPYDFKLINNNIESSVINDVTIASSFKNSSIEWSGEQGEYKSFVRYMLIFSKNDVEHIVSLAPGVNQYNITPGFVDSVLLENFGITTYSPEFNIEIRALFATDSNDHLILPTDSLSSVIKFVPLKEQDFDLTLNDNIINFVQSEHFSSVQFVFVNGESNQSITYHPTSESIDIVNLLDGMSGKFEMFVNAKGVEDVLNNINIAFSSYMLQKLECNGLEVINIHGDYFLRWNDAKHAQSYKISGLGEDIVLFTDIDKGNYFNEQLNKWMYPINLAETGDVKTVSVMAIAKDSTDTSWYFNSDTTSIQVMKYPEVEFQLAGRTIEWNLTDAVQRHQGYTVQVKEQDSEEIIFSGNAGVHQNVFNTAQLEKGTYTISVSAKAVLEVFGNPLYLLDSNMTHYQFTKLGGVDFEVTDGRLTWNRTVEGSDNSFPHTTPDEYVIYKNGQVYEVDIIESNDKMIANFQEPLLADSYFTIAVKRASDEVNFVISNESTPLLVSEITATNFAKEGEYFNFDAALLMGEQDVAEGYIITATHGQNESYAYQEINIGANGQYFADGKYKVPVGDLNAGAGEYTFNLKTIGSMHEGTAYLGSAEKQNLTVIRLKNPVSNQVTVDRGELTILKYNPASSNSIDKPVIVELSFYKNEVLYKQPITYAYNNFDFSDSNRITLTLPGDFTLEAGSYKLYVQFIGDGNNHVLNSAKILANDEMFVEKLSTLQVYIENGLLQWQQEPRAVKYQVMVNSDNIEDVEVNFLTTTDWQTGETTVQVKAYADNCLTSDWSHLFTAKKLNAPLLNADVVNGTKAITWNALPQGVSAYNIYQSNAGEESGELIDQVYGNNYWKVNKNQPQGMLSYYVVAKGSVDTRTQQNKLLGYLDSNSSSALEISFIEPTIEASLVSGILTWQHISGVLKYRIDIYDFLTYYSQEAEAELVYSTTVSTNTFNPSMIAISQPPSYVVVISIDTINANSKTVVSTNAEAFTYELPIVKIDDINDWKIYDNLRIEDGKFAFDITRSFLINYTALLSEVNPAAQDLYSSNINIVTLEKMLAGEEIEDAMAFDLMHPLINFNVDIKYDNNAVMKLTTQMPSGYNRKGDDITIYYEIESMAGLYSVEFQSLGNTSSMDVVGVVHGNKTAPLKARKVAQPLSPISEEGVSINNGKLTWAYPDMFTGDFIIELIDEEGDVITKTVTVGTVPDVNNPWQAVIKNNIIMLDLAQCTAKNELQAEVGYNIMLYAKGTEDSTSTTGEVYLNGEVNYISQMFKVLANPETFTIDMGELYWKTIEGAVGYSITLYLHDGNDYKLLQVNGNSSIILQGNDSDTNWFSLQDIGLPAGNYKIELRAVGNNENIVALPSSVASVYGVLLDSIKEIIIDDGRFAFEEVLYYDIDPEDGSILDEKSAQSYFVAVVERRDGRVIDSIYVGSQNIRKENDLYYVELGDNFRLNDSDYRIEVYTNGNSEYLLSSDSVVSQHFMRSVAPSEFTIDETGLITWSQTDDYYVVFVSEQIVDFEEDGEIKNYTTKNYFNINDYVKSINGEYNKEYYFYVRALKDNDESIMPVIRSERAGRMHLFVMEDPTITLIDGDINWQSNIYNEIKENIAKSFLTISGEFMINQELKVATLTILCSPNITVFENKTYIVQLDNNGNYYLDMANPQLDGETLSMVDNNEYEFSLQYIGNTGEIAQSSYVYVTSSVQAVDGFISQAKPQNLQAVSGETLENDVSSNFIIWSPVQDATSYRIKVYGYNEWEELELVKVYETTSFEAPLYGVLDGGEHAGKLYFAVDETIKFINENDYGQIVVYEVISKGKNWSKGVGDKIMSSVPSQSLEVDYPLSPNNFLYNGKGAVTWENASGGSVIIEVKYKVKTQLGYYDAGNYVNNHQHEIISRTVENGYAIDIIEVPNQEAETRGYYQLKYLTDDIEFITIKTLFEGLNSRKLQLDKGGTLSQGYAKFDLFQGGDGSEVAPFIIKDRASLYNVNHYLNSHFKLNNDIQVTGNWTPIGSALNTAGTVYAGRATEFTGSFNGDSKILSNVRLAGEDVTIEFTRYAGFFYSTGDGAVIKNLQVTFTSDNITATGIDLVVGGLVAKTNKGQISNVIVSGTMVAATGDNSTYIGGITFDNQGVIMHAISNNLSINHAFNRQAIVGGIAVNNYNEIKESGVRNGTLTGTTVGGVVAVNYAKISKSYFTGDLKINANSFNGDCYFGGIAAIAEGLFEGDEYNPSSIKECYAEIDSVTVEYVKAGASCHGGGLVGENKSLQNILDIGYVSLVSYTTNENHSNSIRIGIVYGFHPQGVTGTTQHVYYYDIDFKLSNIAGNANLSWSNVTAFETLDDCVDSLNFAAGDAYAFRIYTIGDKKYIELDWEGLF